MDNKAFEDVSIRAPNFAPNLNLKKKKKPEFISLLM